MVIPNVFAQPEYVSNVSVKIMLRRDPGFGDTFILHAILHRMKGTAEQWRWECWCIIIVLRKQH